MNYDSWRLRWKPAQGGPPIDDLIERLDRLEKRANQLKRPIAYESMMYLLRNHIAVVRDQLKSR